MSLRPEIRNPVLTLPAVGRIREQIPAQQRALLADLLMDLRADALERAKHSWKRHKAPMAAYWKAVGVYAGHIARAIRKPTPDFALVDERADRGADDPDRTWAWTGPPTTPMNTARLIADLDPQLAATALAPFLAHQVDGERDRALEVSYDQILAALRLNQQQNGLLEAAGDSPAPPNPKT